MLSNAISLKTNPIGFLKWMRTQSNARNCKTTQSIAPQGIATHNSALDFKEYKRIGTDMNLEELYQKTKLKRSGLRIGKHKRSPPREWNETRAKVYDRDKGICQSPLNHPICIGKTRFLSFEECHIDHTMPLSCGGSNHITNLRVLCEVCHALRLGKEHRGLLSRMLKLNKMPDNYEDHFWEG